MRIDLYSLTNITRYDPDGMPTEPTAESYQRFRRWVAEAYGNDVLNAYLDGTLIPDDSPHNENGTSDDF